MEVTRRDAIASLAAITTVPGVAAVAGAAQAATTSARGPMNFQDPVDNLDALARIYAANDGATWFWYATGRLYVVRPGEIAQRLFDIAAAQWIRFVPQSDGTFRQQSAFAQLHYDDQGRFLQSMANPLTGKAFKVPLMQSGTDHMSQVEFSIYGSRRLDGPGAQQRMSPTPKVYEWKVTGDEVVLTYEAMSRYKAPWMPVMGTENSVRFYLMSLAHLNDRARPAVHTTRFEYSETSFMPWLEMPAGQAGHLLWRMTASKHARREEVPEKLRDELRQHAPEFFAGFVKAG